MYIGKKCKMGKKEIVFPSLYNLEDNGNEVKINSGVAIDIKYVKSIIDDQSNYYLIDRRQMYYDKHGKESCESMDFFWEAHPMETFPIRDDHAYCNIN